MKVIITKEYMNTPLLTISIEEDQAEDHAERMDVKLLCWAIPGVTSVIMSHPHARDHHTCHPEHLWSPHVPRERPQAAHAQRDHLHDLRKPGGKRQEDKVTLRGRVY